MICAAAGGLLVLFAMIGERFFGRERAGWTAEILDGIYCRMMTTDEAIALLKGSIVG